jgi:hypothetical protein
VIELLDELRLLHPGQIQATPVSSCAALNDLPWSSPSGYYWVRASNGSALRVYCDMTRLCGGVTGGWMRLAELNMTNSSRQCPSGFRQRTDINRRTCVSNITSESHYCHQSLIFTLILKLVDKSLPTKWVRRMPSGTLYPTLLLTTAM